MYQMIKYYIKINGEKPPKHAFQPQLQTFTLNLKNVTVLLCWSDTGRLAILRELPAENDRKLSSELLGISLAFIFVLLNLHVSLEKRLLAKNSRPALVNTYYIIQEYDRWYQKKTLMLQSYMGESARVQSILTIIYRNITSVTRKNTLTQRNVDTWCGLIWESARVQYIPNILYMDITNWYQKEHLDASQRRYLMTSYMGNLHVYSLYLLHCI